MEKMNIILDLERKYLEYLRMICLRGYMIYSKDFINLFDRKYSDINILIVKEQYDEAIPKLEKLVNVAEELVLLLPEDIGFLNTLCKLGIPIDFDNLNDFMNDMRKKYEFHHAITLRDFGHEKVFRERNDIPWEVKSSIDLEHYAKVRGYQQVEDGIIREIEETR